MKNKTICQGPQDLIKPNGQPSQPVLEPVLEGAHHMRVLGLLHPLTPGDKPVRTDRGG